MIRVQILAVANTSSETANSDKCGLAVQDILAGQPEPKFAVLSIQTVPNDENAIVEAVKAWAKSKDVDWIITTGGTGFGAQNRTPEALSRILEHNAPGIVHFLLSSSIAITPLAALLRPAAGIIGQTLVITLPGSPKAAKESLGALLQSGIVVRALELIRDGSENEVEETNGATEKRAGSDAEVQPESHQPQHVPQVSKPRTSNGALSHDPSLGVSARHRQSPYPMISFDDAINKILSEIRPLDIISKSVDRALPGHVIAEDVHAPQDIPVGPTANVDGYALRSTDPTGKYNVVTSRTHPLGEALPPNTIYRISNGAPLPAGTDAVIMVEDTRLVSTSKAPTGQEEEQTVETMAQVDLRENIRAPGSDVMAGERVLERGDLVGSGGGEIGTLAFVGRKKVQVYRKPVVAIMSTGNELSDIQSGQQNTAGGWKGVWDTNRPSLKAALEGLGYHVVDLGIVPDDTKAHEGTILSGIMQADVLVSTGGSSMGAADLFKPVLERKLGGTVHFGRVAVKPGKPTTFATVPFLDAEGGVVEKPVFGLPGNPASALVTFYLFVVPALRCLGGWPRNRCSFPRVNVELTEDLRLDPDPEFHRVHIRASQRGLTASSTGGQRSSRVASLAGANGFVVLPRLADDGREKLTKGETAEAIIIGEIEGETFLT
ncbi:hypothetical protein BOTBODRAFT_152142 [Botryobasidium botryosum FD-172 SS1]|uniref:MoaB/Mog domain-containing protein n=1 Tax=Botryobasidium botryosum (strain FD-172 SS1) TaxID=930990 RepID=A0A067NBE1_BOTB1|nr:hypothetical protein BOTBODRAFT_152142 [Botryobasidium botryosum FD-172 SS1]